MNSSSSTNFYELGKLTAKKIGQRITQKNKLLERQISNNVLLKIENKIKLEKDQRIEQIRNDVWRCYENFNIVRGQMFNDVLSLNTTLLEQMATNNKMLLQDKIKMLFIQEDRNREQSFNTIKSAWLLLHKNQKEKIKLFGQEQATAEKHDIAFQTAFKALEVAFTAQLKNLGEKLETGINKLLEQIHLVNRKVDDIMKQFTDLDAFVHKMNASLKEFMVTYSTDNIARESRFRIIEANIGKHGRQIKSLALGLMMYPPSSYIAGAVLIDAEAIITTVGTMAGKAMGYKMADTPLAPASEKTMKRLIGEHSEVRDAQDAYKEKEMAAQDAALLAQQAAADAAAAAAQQGAHPSYRATPGR